MTKKEIKQYLRNQINSTVKIKRNMNWFDLCYNKNYLRALKLSKINGKPVNKENFKGGEPFFCFDTKTKTSNYYSVIMDYLEENYSNSYVERLKIVEEVINEYPEYKDYNW